MIILSGDELADAPGILAGRRAARPSVSGAIVDLVQDEVRTPDGELIKREYLAHPGAVGIIALDDQDRVILVRQYRHPVRHRLIEPPAGLLDVGRRGSAAGRPARTGRGGRAGRRAAGTCWSTCSPPPGIIGESLRIFLARGLTDIDAPEGFVRGGRGGAHGHRPGLAGRSASPPCSPVGCTTRPWCPGCSPRTPPASATGSPRCGRPTPPGRAGSSGAARTLT